jgi:hypothetical protein
MTLRGGGGANFGTKATWRSLGLVVVMGLVGLMWPCHPESCAGLVWPYDAESYAELVWPCDPESYAGLVWPCDPERYTGLVWPCDPESYAGDSLTISRPTHA